VFIAKGKDNKTAQKGERKRDRIVDEKGSERKSRWGRETKKGEKRNSKRKEATSS